MKKHKAKMGRPPMIDQTKKRGTVTTFKLTSRERAELQRDADKQGMTVSAYIVYCWKQQKVKA